MFQLIQNQRDVVQFCGIGVPYWQFLSVPCHIATTFLCHGKVSDHLLAGEFEYGQLHFVTIGE